MKKQKRKQQQEHKHSEQNQYEQNECRCGEEHHEQKKCCCGQEHHEQEECCCGQEHHEQEECCYGQEHHEHQHHEQKEPSAISKNGTKLTYLVENLGCANCAAKMEKQINDLPGVNAAVLTFATKQLRLSVAPETAKKEDALLESIQEICSSIESEVIVKRQLDSQRGKQALSDREEQAHCRFSQKQIDGFSILAGALLFISGEVLEHIGYASVTLPVYIAAYLILGGQILFTALKNLGRGQIFDENFLMSIATLGAFAIKEYPEAVGVMLFYRIGELFEEIAVERSRSQIMEAVDLRPEVVNLVVGSSIETIPAKDARRNDILLVRPGDRIPLDGVIVEGESRLDTSPITGEPAPVKAAVNDKVISGCINTSGQLKIRVEQTLENSMVTRILDSVENAAASKPQIDRFITRFARIYTPFVVIAALATAILPSLFTGDWEHWIYTALTFLVISCPCALVLSVPLAFFSGIGAGSRKGILFKGGVSIEALNRIKTVVMDKTGTITKGDFTVQSIVPLADYTEEELLALCASCEQNSSHPIAVSIVNAAKIRNLSLETAASLEEISGHGMKASFLQKDSFPKESPSLQKDSSSQATDTSRAQKEILVGNQKLMERFHIDTSSLRSRSYGTEVLIAIDGRLSGYIVIADTIKEEAAPAIQRLKNMQML